MKPRIRRIARAGAILFALIIIATLVAGIGMRRSVPSEEGSIAIPGLADRVTVRRDRYGIPSIEAKNLDDLLVATGYVTASDRLWQMTIMKMLIQGRLAEMNGHQFLGIDHFMRCMPARSFVNETWRDLDDFTRRGLEAYARGVNAYLATDPVLPVEFHLTGWRPEAWQPQDSLWIFCILNLGLSVNFLEELHFLNLSARVGYDRAVWLFPVQADEPLPRDEARKLAAVDPASLNLLASRWQEVRRLMAGIAQVGLPASNNWALAGWRTKSGRPIVANDTHLEIMMPNTWMYLRQQCPEFTVAGVMAPGIPLVLLGANTRVAWGATMVLADTQDVFVEQLTTRDGSLLYRYRGQWLPVEERPEIFKVKGGESVTRTVRSTRHGALISDPLSGEDMGNVMTLRPYPVHSAYGLALSWAMPDGAASLSAIGRMVTARSAAELQGAIRRIGCLYLNFVFADRNNIGWQVSGRMPLRREGRGKLPSPGWDGRYDWTGFAPTGVNPSSFNPEEGYIVTANNRTVPAGFQPVISSSWYNAERAERITAVLKETRGAVAEDSVRLQGDVYSLFARRFQEVLFTTRGGEVRAAVNALPGPDRVRATEALALIDPKNFDAVMDARSPRAALMGALVHTTARELFLDELGPDDSIAWRSFTQLSVMCYSALQDHLLYRHDSPFWDDVRTPERESAPQILARSLARAVSLLEERLGGNRSSWQWGRLHAYRWHHEFSKVAPPLGFILNRGPYPAGGDGHTVNVSTPQWGEGFDVIMIPAMRMVADYGRTEPFMIMGTHGQSGNPASPHYDDMIPRFLDASNETMPLGEAAAHRRFTKVLTLRPRPAAIHR